MALVSRVVVVGLALAGMAACARTSVENVNVRTGVLPRPQAIVVYDFVVSPGDVSLNSGIGSRLLHMVRETPVSEEELKLGREVSRIVADHLVKEINKTGIAAFPASATVPIAVPSLAIEGQFLSVDEGNRLRRMVIGFGAGASELRTLVQVYETTPEGRRLVEDFYTTVKSSIKPGIAPMVPVGAAVAAGAATSAVVSGSVGIATAGSQSVESDARHTAEEIAKMLKKFFVEQGWILP